MDNGASSYRRYLSGDEAAFEQIVKDYYDPLTLFINSYVHDLAAAEDIAIDTFSDLIVHKYRYNFRSSMKTYLFMIGRSRALNYIKHRDHFQTVELESAEKDLPYSPSPEAKLSENERKQAIHDGISQLDAPLREVVQLVYFEEMCCEDAA